MNETSLPIFQDVPAGSKVTVQDREGNTILVYTTPIDIPAGSKVSLKTP